MTGAFVLSIFLYAALLVTFVALLALLAPFRPFRSRRGAAITALLSVVAAVIIALTPAPLQRVQSRAMLIDRFMPEFHHFERHETIVHAPRADVFRAIEEVRPSEIRLFLLLTSIRGLGGRRPLAGSEPPLLEVSKEGGFIELARADDREIVQGTVGQFWRMRASRPDPPVRDGASFAAPHAGFAKATINFAVFDEGEATRVVTETRIFCPDRDSMRRFTAYWRAIFPGSALIRMMWLEAIKKKAEVRPVRLTPEL